MVALVAEVLLVGCAVAAFVLHRARRRRLEELFTRAHAAARRLALDARIVDASVAELSELVIDDALRELGLGSSTDPR
ncbi:MAG TPA: hypothetical protein VMV22_08930 [Acidimicrobiales bacterium]|nr:hypothetical protein [Acidimicrobiales bacterium]